ncbi:hypothetical protein XELAEV_18042003mg [Xenopus laevis]|uniref:Uncharacterized protein n=1 Tax=Xenopus laevis TaxID=8355 RepID=A0A974C4D3_XENLA|nr:hypothetical protein XELAEV_18042003mg [Xenopus laevis]
MDILSAISEVNWDSVFFCNMLQPVMALYTCIDQNMGSLKQQNIFWTLIALYLGHINFSYCNVLNLFLFTVF